MGKKKDKLQVINNIQELNLEIDYEKLAVAIVKAQNVAKEESQPVKKVGFWKAVGQTIINKEAKNGKRTAILLTKIMNTIFNFMALIGVLLAISTVAVSIQKLNWDINVWQFAIQSLIVGIFVVVTLAISLIFRAVANEIGAEKDRNYISTLFFGFASLASLIVALIALF